MNRPASLALAAALLVASLMFSRRSYAASAAAAALPGVEPLDWIGSPLPDVATGEGAAAAWDAPAPSPVDVAMEAWPDVAATLPDEWWRPVPIATPEPLPVPLPAPEPEPVAAEFEEWWPIVREPVEPEGQAVPPAERETETAPGGTMTEPPAPTIAERVRELFTPGANMQDVTQAVDHPNVQAALAMIRRFEGGPEGYNALFGGRGYRFEDFSDHPRRIVTVMGRDGRGNPRQYSSPAAGAYQIMAAAPDPATGAMRFTREDTWGDIQRALSLPDFSPRSQDIAATWLIKRRGALADFVAGNFAVAINKIRREWASLPGAGYDQPEKSFAEALAAYTQAGGQVAQA